VKRTGSPKLRIVSSAKDADPTEETPKERKGDPVVAARFRAARVELGIPYQKDMIALMVEASKRNGGRTTTYDNTYISRLETGDAPGDKVQVHSAYAAALGLTRDEWGDYIDGITTIEDIRKIRDQRLKGKAGPQTLRRLPTWETLKAQAKKLDPALCSADFEAIADSTVNGPPERVTPMRIAVMAKMAHEMGGDE
jgi:hypothetical protein